MASVLALSRAESANAKRMSRWALWAHALTVVLAFAALVLDAPWVYWLAFGTLLGEGAAWWSRLQALATHSRAETARRRALLITSFGADPGDLDTVDVTQRLTDWARRNASKYEDGEYWSSTLPPGPTRLKETLQESAFWSTHLYRAAATRALRVFGGLVLIVGVAALALVFADAGEVGVMAARAIVVILTALVATDALADSLRWSSASRAAETVDRRLVSADLSDPGTLAAIIADYATATEGAAPIPNRLYEKCHNRLNTAWQQRQS